MCLPEKLAFLPWYFNPFENPHTLISFIKSCITNPLTSLNVDINPATALIIQSICPSPRWVQVLSEAAALHPLLAHRQRSPPVGQRLGPAGSLPAAAELPGDPAAQDPAHRPEALWPQHPLPPQPQPPDASREVGGNTTSASLPPLPPQKLFTQSHQACLPLLAFFFQLISSLRSRCTGTPRMWKDVCGENSPMPVFFFCICFCRCFVMPYRPSRMSSIMDFDLRFLVAAVHQDDLVLSSAHARSAPAYSCVSCHHQERV